MPRSGGSGAHRQGAAHTRVSRVRGSDRHLPARRRRAYARCQGEIAARALCTRARTQRDCTSLPFAADPPTSAPPRPRSSRYHRYLRPYRRHLLPSPPSGRRLLHQRTPDVIEIALPVVPSPKPAITSMSAFASDLIDTEPELPLLDVTSPRRARVRRLERAAA